MKSRLLSGKTITRVIQEPFFDSGGKRQWSLEAIEFTDGSVLRFVVIEGEDEYGIYAVYPGREVGVR